MASAALAREIKANHLRHCYYLMIREIRVAVEEVPSDERFPCSACSSPSEYTLLGEGGTHRTLLFWDKIRDSVSLKELIGSYCRAQKAQAASASA
jgi:hypothetical protein